MTGIRPTSLRINAGVKLNRFLYPANPGDPMDQPADYPVPPTPYKAISYKRFWRVCRSMKSSGYASKTSRQAAYQRYGGGGLSDLPTQIGAWAWIDETPIPEVFFVDADTGGLPIGQCTMTVLREGAAGALAGWDLCAGAPTSSSIMRTILHANLPKDVPPHLLERDPQLPWIG
jgi:hypothetical protein